MAQGRRSRALPRQPRTRPPGPRPVVASLQPEDTKKGEWTQSPRRPILVLPSRIGGPPCDRNDPRWFAVAAGLSTLQCAPLPRGACRPTHESRRTWLGTNTTGPSSARGRERRNMTRRAFAWLAALATAVVALAAVVVAPAAPAAVQANEVTNWNRIAANTLVAFPPAASGAPPALQIN